MGTVVDLPVASSSLVNDLSYMTWLCFPERHLALRGLQRKVLLRFSGFNCAMSNPGGLCPGEPLAPILRVFSGSDSLPLLLRLLCFAGLSLGRAALSSLLG